MIYSRLTTIAIGLAVNVLLSGCWDELLRTAKEVEGKAIAVTAPCITEYGDPRPLTDKQAGLAAHLAFPQSLSALRNALGQPAKICGGEESYPLPHGGSFVVQFNASGMAVSANWRNE